MNINKTNKLQVLVVEDVPIGQKIAELTLIQMGCSVDVAGSGLEALKMAEEKRYHLILMDLGLPDIHGTEVARLIRSSEKINYHVPIVALTATQRANDHAACMDSGMDYFLSKPLRPENKDILLTFANKSYAELTSA